MKINLRMSQKVTIKNDWLFLFIVEIISKSAQLLFLLINNYLTQPVVFVLSNQPLICTFVVLKTIFIQYQKQ